ncbi:hypothetical protein CONCODRAFT_167054 [Conidiobolus coronatus NRRL 28638]|uniref:Uncharacterized protein n=1 Tax=Conidiobolus coronatus (strain ATCC 28846 / CBS 209.66 / NRRL 28638) TaxID=796925 RepID=A0A137NYG9_CONC2|nr:hypothetical protein CONCODRAFT_167054 [Conidiobolus coronatus NRRL 28638]|eukprot:KXN67845.1 hypothetical protein CONCODRAFT_167054 [Conidiobolus coronatus NRRL 28638]
MFHNEIDYNNKNINILADYMTMLGYPVGIIKSGLSKYSNSTFTLAAYEKGKDDIIQAARNNKEEMLEEFVDEFLSMVGGQLIKSTLNFAIGVFVAWVPEGLPATDKTGTLARNQMTVTKIWSNLTMYSALRNLQNANNAISIDSTGLRAKFDRTDVPVEQRVEGM